MNETIVEFDKKKMEELLEAVKFYEENREKIKEALTKAIKYSKEIRIIGTKVMEAEK